MLRAAALGGSHYDVRKAFTVLLVFQRLCLYSVPLLSMSFAA